MAAECGNIGEGFPPLLDGGTYLGLEATLHPGGSEMPAEHAALGVLAGAAVVRLDAAGDPDDGGLVGLLTLGISNANQETDHWTANDDGKLQAVIVANGAVGGIGASEMDESYFVTVDGRVITAGLTNAQIQWIWLKTAEPDESGAFPGHAQTLQANIKAALQIAVVRYPNLQGVSISSRVYGGYGDLVSSPSLEPWAYQGGYAVKWLIESQIDGSDPDLAYGSFPWLGWGPYLWADGLTQRSDGLIYECTDFQADGAHPDTGAKVKVTALLNDYFRTAAQTKPWYWGKIHVQALGSLADNTDATSYGVTLTQPAALEPVIAFVESRVTGATPNTPTLSGCGLTWIEVKTRPFNTEAAPRARLTVFRAAGPAPAAGTLTADFDGQTQSVCHVSVMQCIGARRGTNGGPAVRLPVADSADAVGSITATLAAAAELDSIVLAGFAIAAATGLAPEASWTLVHTLTSSPNAARLTTAFETVFDTSATGTLTSGTQDMAVIALEILPARSGEVVGLAENAVYVPRADNVAYVPRADNVVIGGAQ